MGTHRVGSYLDKEYEKIQCKANAETAQIVVFTLFSTTFEKNIK